jgi:hypothetical protein
MLGDVAGLWPFTVTWNYVGALALVAVSSRIGASLNAQTRARLSIAYLVATAGATFIGVASLLTLIGLQTWPAQAPELMAIAVLYLLAAHFHKDGPAKRALPVIAGVAAVVLTFSGLIASSSQWIDPIIGSATDLWLAAFSLEAAVFFAVAARTNRGKHNVYLSSVMVCGMMYQLLGFWRLPTQSYSVAIAIAGVAGLVGRRLLGADGRGNDPIARAVFISANALVSLPMAAVSLMTLSRLAGGHGDLAMLWAPAILSLLSLLSAALAAPGGGARRWYFSLMIVQLALCLLTLGQYSNLSWPRKMESLSVVTGLLLLAVGYALWYREQTGHSESAGICLLFGALLAGLPPAIFALINRFGFEVSFVDELALVTIAVLMFLTGAMCRIRATTLVGGGLLSGHLITLIVFAGMKAQLAVGAYVAIGGAVLFVIGLLLSVYRDRLLAMPQRIKHRQGLFRVLAWR